MFNGIVVALVVIGFSALLGLVVYVLLTGGSTRQKRQLARDSYRPRVVPYGQLPVGLTVTEAWRRFYSSPETAADWQDLTECLQLVRHETLIVLRRDSHDGIWAFKMRHNPNPGSSGAVMWPIQEFVSVHDEAQIPADWRLVVRKPFTR